MRSDLDAIIRFSGLKSGVYNYSFDVDSTFFERYNNEDFLGASIHFDVRFEKKERLMLLYFSFQGSVDVLCDRCLERMVQPVSGREMLTVRISDDEVCDDEDVVVLPEKAYELDISQWLYEYVVVAVPMRHVHPDDENGEPTCSEEMVRYISCDETLQQEGSSEGVVDERWAGLADLLNDK